MAETVEELTVSYEDGGVETVKELIVIKTGIEPKKNTARINLPFAVIKNETVSISKNQNLIFRAKSKQERLLVLCKSG